MALASTSFVTLAALHGWCRLTPGALKSVSSLTAAAGLATATVPNHLVQPLDTVTIAGADQAAYNGAQTVTILDADRFTFAVTGGPTSPATGTITMRASQDTILTKIGDRVCLELEQGTGKYFTPRDAISETRNGEGVRSIALRHLPVRAVTSVTVDEALLESTTYVVDLDRGMVTLKVGRFTKGVGNVTIVYNAGYAASSAPLDIVNLAEELAKYLYDRWAVNASIATSINLGPANVTLVTGLPRDLRDAIARHRDTRFG